jgi:glucose-6-phosphate 1-epimerase
MPTNDINILNRNYGSPERIAFRECPAGHPLISLADSRGSCEIALYGAHVLSYRPTGQNPVLWRSKRSAKVASGKPIRGGIPVCWPWFGDHPTDAKQPNHGFARLRRWRLLSTAYDSRQTSVRLQLTHDAETLTLWPYAFRLELTVSVSDMLSLELIATNKGDAPFTLTQAFHPYFLVRQIDEIRVLGLENTAYQDLSPTARDDRQHGALQIQEETDRLYRKTAGDCTLVDPGIGRKIVVSQRGSHSTVVWNPWIEKAKRLSDMENDDYRHFVCVEPANADTDTVTLEPGAEHLLGLTIQSLPA